MEVLPAVRCTVVPDVEELGRRAPAWVPDTASTNCQECGRHFSFLVRRHHCRSSTFLCRDSTLPAKQCCGSEMNLFRILIRSCH
jgi:hypothetical protein